MKKMITIFLFIIFYCGLTGDGWGQQNFVSWDFNTSITSANYATNLTNQDGARSTDLTNVTLSSISLTSCTGVAANTFHRTTSWSTLFDANKFMEFSITMTNGDTYANNTLDLGILAAVSSATAAAKDYQVHYGWGSSPTFALATNGTVNNLGTTSSSNVATIPAPGNTTTTVLKIRIHGYNHGTGSGNLRLYTVSLDGPTPLPVELSSFSALPKGNGVQLTWATATEINNFGFEVERSQKPVVSSENSTWQEIGFVKGNGNSNSPKDYSYTDNTLSNSGKYIYRLKQIDNDGTVTYSNEIETDVTVVLEYGLSQNYPNPFNPATVINYTLAEPGFVTIKVYNMLGEEVTTLVNGQMEAGKHTLQFDGHNLSSGMYLYKITAGNFTQVKKMLLTK